MGKRDKLAAVLSETGFIPYVPEGGYFMMADVSKLPPAIFEEIKNSGDDIDEPFDFRFSKWLIRSTSWARFPRRPSTPNNTNIWESTSSDSASSSRIPAWTKLPRF